MTSPSTTKAGAAPLNTPQGKSLHDDLALLCAGHPVSVVIEGLTRALANTLGFAAPCQEAAAAMCADTAHNMVGLIAANWSELRVMRAAGPDRSAGRG